MQLGNLAGVTALSMDLAKLATNGASHPPEPNVQQHHA